MTEPITWTNVTVKLSQLEPWEDNPKSSTAKNAKQLQDSKDQLGQFQTVAIGPKNGSGCYPVYDGHQRLSAWATAYGRDSDIDARRSSRPLTEQERRKIALYSRQIGAWDWDILSSWQPVELTEWGGFDGDLLLEWRRDVASLGNFLESEEEGESRDAEPKIDRAAELQKEWGTAVGQLWRMESRTSGNFHLLICGDCTDAGVVERVMMGEKATIVWTDPPYGMDLDTDFSDMVGIGKGNKYERVVGDDSDYDPAHIFRDFEYCKEIFLWGADYYAERIPKRNDGSWLVWDKMGGGDGANDSYDKMFGSNFELCWSRKRHKRALIRILWKGIFGLSAEDTKRRVHPTQKPAKLAEWCLEKFSKTNDIAVDLFAGSSPCIIAAENLSRQAHCIELAPGYVAVALQRYLDAFGITAELIDTL